jgi:hypothetical protein
MRILIILMLSGTLGVLGCATDETTDGTGGSAGSGGSGGEAGMGGEGGAGLPSAEQFCDDFEVFCDYGGDNYDDRADCLATYDSYNDGGTCVVTHLGFAGDWDEGTPERVSHCGHASGFAICSTP